MGTLEAGRLFLERTVDNFPAGSEDLNDALAFDTTALHGIRCIVPGTGFIRCKLPVHRGICSDLGVLHGGCIGLGPIVRGVMMYCGKHVPYAI